MANYNWGSVPGLYAVVGHEITGVVSKIGDNVKANLNKKISFLFYQTIFIKSNEPIKKIRMNVDCKDKDICFYFCRTIER